MAILVVLSSEPTCHDIQVDVIDGPEFVIGGEVGVELDGEMMSRWEEEDGRDMGNVMLLKDVANCDTFGCIMEGVFGVWESGVCINENSIIIIIVSGDDFTSRGKIGAKGILGN